MCSVHHSPLGLYQYEINKVLQFWFNQQFGVFRPEWFSHELDETILTRFGELHKQVENKELEYWKRSKYGKLAYIIVLDQFTRNLDRNGDFRRNDETVLELVESMLRNREDRHYFTMSERMFILLPLRHSKSSRNIRRVLEILEEYKKEMKEGVLSYTIPRMDYSPQKSVYGNCVDILEKFKIATIRDLTKCLDEYIYTNIDEKVDINKEEYADILDLDYVNREKKDSSIDGFLRKPNQSAADIENIVATYLSKNKIKKVGMSLSGGIDSMVALKIMAKLLGSENVTAVHVCHSNREVSIRELEFLIKWCNSRGVVLVYRKVDYMNRESVDRDFYESETNAIRFGLYRYVIEKENLDGMCLGHHRDDIGENVMMNILHNRDVLDLKGMCDRKKMNGVMILRPLLEVKKDVVWNYGKEKDICCFKDSTPDWSWRGVLRRQIYPKLDERVGSIHSILSELGDKSEEWNTIVEKMIFQPLFNSIKYADHGCMIPLSTTALEMPGSFYTKLFLHVFHTMGIKMISVKCQKMFLDWIRNNRETYCMCSNGYIMKRVENELFILDKRIIEKQNWSYTVELNTDKEEIRTPCTWKDILNGTYEYTEEYTEENGIIEVKVFNKSDNTKKLVKGFDFLPKVTSIKVSKSNTKRAFVQLVCTINSR
jgi:tRNA(Ile)-lysidine synthetase-like protein